MTYVNALMRSVAGSYNSGGIAHKIEQVDECLCVDEAPPLGRLTRGVWHGPGGLDTPPGCTVRGVVAGEAVPDET